MKKGRWTRRLRGDVHTHFFTASDVLACIGAEEISAQLEWEA